MFITQIYYNTYEYDHFHVSIAGVPFDLCQELHGHLTTVHHSSTFSTSREGSRVSALQTNKQINKPKRGDLCPYGRTQVVMRRGPGIAFHNGRRVRDRQSQAGPQSDFKINYIELN